MKEYINVDSALQPINTGILDAVAVAFNKAMADENEKTVAESWVEHENRLYHYIEQGDVEGLMALFNETSFSPRAGFAVNDSRLRAQYFAVSSLTLTARAAIRGGLGENEAFCLSDVYINFASKLSDENEIMWLIATSVLDYTQRVYQAKTETSRSAVIVFCCNYIVEHIHTNVSLADLSRVCHLSREHLSRLFKKETGCTMKAYSLSKKLESAAFLLTTTDRTIQDIAFYLGFSSHGRFSGYFRQRFGKTPREYRYSC